MNRRTFLASLPLLTSARSLLGAAGAHDSRIGLCTFSCHQLWKTVQSGKGSAPFQDGPGFYRYSRTLGAEGVQTSLRDLEPEAARRFRNRVEADGGYFEGELNLPRSENDIAAFENQVRLLREAGATIARAVLLGGRRYEVFKTQAEFREFQAQAAKRLHWVEPILRRQQLRMAVENHKDLTTPELLETIRQADSEWIGVLVDTGNNLALLEEPQQVVEALAPFAWSVHLKDMAVQPYSEGFLLSEVPLGTGVLDLKAMVATLRKHNPRIVFNLEMATRDPLPVPCRTEKFFDTFPGQRAARLEPTLDWVRRHPPTQSPPVVRGKEIAQVLREEESHNRQGLGWMRRELKA